MTRSASHRVMIYKDRTEAGRYLGRLMKQYGGGPVVVLGLPNGGIPVGIEIARELGCLFDLLFVSKITPDFNSEVGYGSVSESGNVILNEGLVSRLGLRPEEVDQGIRNTKRKITSRMRNFNPARGRTDVAGKRVILADDGIAGGFTMLNAIGTVRERGASEIVVAVPTAPMSTYNRLAAMVAGIVCPDVRDTDMFAVADAYENWYDIGFDGAMSILRKEGYLLTDGSS
jgi:putative phosphoribosyl transferase